MLVGRVVLGAAEGPQFGAGNALVKRWFPPREQGTATSVWMIGSPIASAIGFPMIFYLVAHFGWRMSFHVLALLNLVIVLPLVWFLLKDFPSSAAPASFSASGKAGRRCWATA